MSKKKKISFKRFSKKFTEAIINKGYLLNETYRFEFSFNGDGGDSTFWIDDIPPTPIITK